MMSSFKVSIILFIYILLPACSREEVSQNTLTIGMEYAGGIILFIDNTGEHGLVCAASNQGTAEWGCMDEFINGADATYVGSGNYNTLEIITNCTDSNIAARICYDLVLNGCDDWYLPSKDELVKMRNNLAIKGLGNFTAWQYWSSSQYNDHGAWYVGMYSNGSTSSFGKSERYYVRAIRAF